MVSTIYGEMDESLLEKREGSEENDNEAWQWIEYWLKGEMVHRSVNMQLKRGIDFGLDAASFT